jgi:membrane protease YdiL (CAAX protease family)
MIAVKRLIQSDITKILIFFILTTACAAAITPWLYNAGMMLVEVTETRPTSAVISWLAQKCDHAELPRYFNRALLLCALILTGPFIMWMKLGKEGKQPRRNPWRLQLPKHSIAHHHGQALTRNPRAWLHFTTGFLLAGSLLMLMIWLLLLTGWFSLTPQLDWVRATQESLVSAAFAGLIEEWIFRGVILGIFLRALRPTMAIVTVSLFFAFIHFLLPPDGVKVLNPDSLDSGFRMISLIAQRFMHPQTFTLSFVSLFVIGLILAYARYRTASLWLPIGLHTGWFFVHRIFQHMAELSGDHLSSMELFISADRKSGLLPLCLLIATGLFVHVFVQISEEKREPDT